MTLLRRIRGVVGTAVMWALPVRAAARGLWGGLGCALATITCEFVPRTPRPAKGMVTDDTGCTDLTENNKRATRSWLV